MKREGKSTGLGEGLGRLVRSLDRKTGGWANVSAARAWREVAGESVAGHTDGIHLRDKQMVVYVDSPSWATELSALSALYIPRLNEELGKDLVESMRFTVSSKVSRTKKQADEQEEVDAFYAPDDVVPIKLTDQELRQVEHSASVIKNERVREAVVRATVADLELQKGRQAKKGREKPREGL